MKGLVCNGGTALGPGLIVALAMAMQGKPGSKVIICTDGLANLGIGAIEFNAKNGNEFYDNMAAYAKNKGIMISVLTIKGDQDCSIKNLGKLSNETNGTISRIDPDMLGSEFSKIISE